jgi:hypothetical protein
MKLLQYHKGIQAPQQFLVVLEWLLVLHWWQQREQLGNFGKNWGFRSKSPFGGPSRAKELKPVILCTKSSRCTNPGAHLHNQASA